MPSIPAPKLARAASSRSLAEMVFARCAQAGARALFREKRVGGGAGASSSPSATFVDTSAQAMATRVEHVAAGLLTAPGGLAAAGRVAILGSTRLDWLVADVAVQSLGAVSVPIYPSLLADEIGFILVDAEVDIAVVENAQQLAKLQSVLEGFTFQGQAYGKERLRLRHIVVMDPGEPSAATGWESLAALENRGKGAAEETADLRDTRLRAIAPTDLCTLAYTSGTTGRPKGVQQSHANFFAVIEALGAHGIITTGMTINGVILFLPLAHSFGRLIPYAAISYQLPLAFSAVETLADDLKAVRPALVPGAPRMYEKIYARLHAAVSGMPAYRRALFHWALGVGTACIPYWEKNAAPPLPLRLQRDVAERLVFGPLKARLGLDRAELLVSGSAPLAPAILEFYLAMGLLLIEAYGLTETTPALAAARPDGWRRGTVGTALKGVELVIAADGEILAKGPNVTAGYWHRPDADADAFDAEGYFHTGDIGRIDEEGFLKITDRKKDLLKTSGGKYVAPVKIEGMLKARELVSEAMVVGDNRKYCTALLVLDDDALAAWAKRTGNPPDRNGKATLDLLKASIDELNRGLASFESLKAFRVVPEPFTVDNGMLTASFKVKRKAVTEHYAALIAEMYPDG